MKKSLSILLTLVLVFALAACGNTAPPPSVTPDSAGATTPPSSTPSPNVSDGDTDSSTSLAASIPSGTVTIPDNGTPPAVEAPLESHAGDSGYFYADTDDYMVWVEQQSGFQRYNVVSFDSAGNIISHFSKDVFQSEDDASAYAAQEDWRVQIGNVVYIDTSLIAMAELMYTDKESAIANNKDYSHYISKP